MAKQITQLPVAASVAASDVFPLDQSGTTKQATLTAIAAGLPAGTGTGGLVRQTNPAFSGGVRITDAVYPFTQWTNTGAPTDKKRLRAYVETSGTTGLARVNDAENVGFPLISFDVNNNCGIGTTTPTSRLTVGGDIRLANNGSAIYFTDTGGTTPFLTSFTDGIFYFSGTSSAGAARAVWQCAMRSDTSPLQVNVPLKIGAGGSDVSAVFTAVVIHTPATIAANGGVQFLDVTVTGLNSACNLLVNSFALSNTSILVRAEFQANNVARVFWVNPTASPVTLAAATYRVSAIVFA